MGCEFGRRGAELLKEAINHQLLAPYNEEQVRLVLNEVKELENATSIIYRSLKDKQEEDGSSEEMHVSAEDLASLTVLNETVKFNKRLLLAYMSERLSRLRQVRWQHRTIPKAVADAACPQELEYYKGYDKLLTRYMSRAEGIGMDLTMEDVPPKDVKVAVRVMQDHGLLPSMESKITLKRCKEVYVPPEEVENLVRDGVVQQTTHKWV